MWTNNLLEVIKHVIYDEMENKPLPYFGKEKLSSHQFQQLLDHNA